MNVYDYTKYLLLEDLYESDKLYENDFYINYNKIHPKNYFLMELEMDELKIFKKLTSMACIDISKLKHSSILIHFVVYRLLSS